MTTTERWIALFSTELERRDVPDERIREEVATVRAHVEEGSDDIDAAFGDPIVYAGVLAGASDDDTPSRGTVLSLFIAIALFIVFAISVVRWLDGDDGNAPWAILSGAGLLAAVAALSVSLTRRAVSTALRDALSRRTEAQWRLSATVLLLVPWTFIAFAALVVAVAAAV